MVKITSKSRAKIRTSMGDMVVEFLGEKAPKTVENFVTLAHKGFYDVLTFHRIVENFMVQGGCPKGDGTGGPGYTIRPEFNDTPHVKGIVSMARSNDPHSAGSQFFICHGEARYLDSRYTAFARVVDGLEVLDKIAGVPKNVETRFNETSKPRDPVYINGIDLTGVTFEKGDDEQAVPTEQEALTQQQEPTPQARSGEASGDGATPGQDAEGAAEDDGDQGGTNDGSPKPKRSRRPRRARSDKGGEG